MMKGQCALAVFTVPLFLHTTSETQHWSTPLNVHYQLIRSLPADDNPSGWVSFGPSLLPRLGVSTDEHMTGNLSLTLATIAASTAKAVAAQQKSLSSLAKMVVDHRSALDSLLAEQGRALP